mmetsp:Transcript_25065/g.45333  ORF Transcript_25065/g.45333 Transcript_25065/m.45333 type:complete len:218 (+) Transcript_25065:596-1249(+)
MLQPQSSLSSFVLLKHNRIRSNSALQLLQISIVAHADKLPLSFHQLFVNSKPGGLNFVPRTAHEVLERLNISHAQDRIAPLFRNKPLLVPIALEQRLPREHGSDCRVVNRFVLVVAVCHDVKNDGERRACILDGAVLEVVESAFHLGLDEVSDSIGVYFQGLGLRFQHLLVDGGGWVVKYPTEIVSDKFVSDTVAKAAGQHSLFAFRSIKLEVLQFF